MQIPGLAPTEPEETQTQTQTRTRCLAQLKGEALGGCLQDDAMQLVLNILEGEALCLSNNTVFLPVQFFSSLKSLESINKTVQRMLRSTRYRTLQGAPRIVGAHFLKENSHWISYETSMPVPVAGVGVCRNLTIFDSLMPPGSSISLPFGVYVPPGSADREFCEVHAKFLPGEFESFDRARKELGDPLIFWLIKMLLFLEVYRAYWDGLVKDWDQGPDSDVLRKLPYYLVTIRGHVTQQAAGKMDCGVYALGHLAGIATSTVVVNDDREGTRRLRPFEETVMSMFGRDSPIIRHIHEAFRNETRPGQFESGSFLFAPAVGSKVANPETLRVRLQTLVRPNYLPIKHQQYAAMKMVEWVFVNLLQPSRIQAYRPTRTTAPKQGLEGRGGGGSGDVYWGSTDDVYEQDGGHQSVMAPQEQQKRRLVVNSSVMAITYWMDLIANLVCTLGIWDHWEIISFEKFAHWIEFNEQHHFITPDNLKTLDPWCVPAAIFNFKMGQTPEYDRSHQEGLAILGRYICSNTTEDPSTGAQHMQPITVLNAFLDEVSPAQRPEYCHEKDWHMQVYSSTRRDGVPPSAVPEFFSRQAPPAHSSPSAARQYLNSRCVDIKSQTLFAPSSSSSSSSDPNQQLVPTACDVNNFPCRFYATGWDSYHVFRKLDADAAAYAKKRSASASAKKR